MKTLKRVFLASLVVTAFSLAGCGRDDDYATPEKNKIEYEKHPQPDDPGSAPRQ